MPEAVSTPRIEKELDEVARGRRTIGGRNSVSTETLQYVQRSMGLEPDGNLDALRDKVKMFQELHNMRLPNRQLAVDGVIGRLTLPLFNDDYAVRANIASIQAGKMRLPETSDERGDRLTISSVETAINQWATTAGRKDLPRLDATDDRRDPNFQTALKEFQRAHGLPSTGYFGRLSAGAIEKYLPTLDELPKPRIMDVPTESQTVTTAAALSMPSRSSASQSSPTPVESAQVRVPSEAPASSAAVVDANLFLRNSHTNFDVARFLPRAEFRQIPPDMPPDQAAGIIRAENEVEAIKAREAQQIHDLMSASASALLANRRPEERQVVLALTNQILDSLAMVHEQDPAAVRDLSAIWSDKYVAHSDRNRLRSLVESGAGRYEQLRERASVEDWLGFVVKDRVALIESAGIVSPAAVNESLFAAFNLASTMLSRLSAVRGQ